MLGSKCRFCLRLFLLKEKNETFHVKYKFMILRDFYFMILRFYSCFLNLCLLYNFSFFQRLEIDVTYHVYIHSYFFIIDGYFIRCKSTINKE